jgi:hypothetical protein
MDNKEMQEVVEEKGAEYKKDYDVKKADVPLTAQELYWALLDVRGFLGKMDRSHRYKSAVDIAAGVIKEMMKQQAQKQSDVDMAS